MWSNNMFESTDSRAEPQSTEGKNYHSPASQLYQQQLINQFYLWKARINESTPSIISLNRSAAIPAARAAICPNNYHHFPYQGNIDFTVRHMPWYLKDNDHIVQNTSSIIQNAQTPVDVASARLPSTGEYTRINDNMSNGVRNITNTWKEEFMPVVQSVVFVNHKYSHSSERKMKLKTQPSGTATRKSGEEKPISKRKSKKPQNIDAKWLSTFEELKKFKQETGHTVVPRGYALNPKLGSWVSEQRKQYRLHLDKKKASITPKRISLLNEVGFVWNAQTGAWERQFEQLEQFYKENGHCNVPISDATHMKQLALWVKEQRRHYTLMKQGKESRMTLERLRRLNELRFCFSTHEERWQHRLTQLEKFKGKHGHCVVTITNASSGLATWVHHQRRQHKKLILGEISHLTMKRVEDLNSLGFVWSRNRSSGNENDSYLSDSESDDGDDDDAIGSSSNDSFSDVNDDNSFEEI